MPTANELAAKLADIDNEIGRLTGALKVLSDNRKELVGHDLPEAMREAGLTKFTTMVDNHEYEVKITNKIVGTLSRAEDPDAALDYLAKKGFKGAAQSVVKVTVPDSEREFIIESLAEISDTKPSVERKINHMTLAAFARECFSNGEGFDLDVVGLTALTEATIKEIT